MNKANEQAPSPRILHKPPSSRLSKTLGGRLIFTIFSAIAEFEREIIRERTRAGLNAARALLADASISVSDMARRLNVAVSTLYRHLPAARATISTLCQNS